MTPRHRKRYRPLLLVLAWAFLLLGLAGLVLPVLQGVLFLLVSLYLFGLVTVRGRLLRIRLRRRFPKVAHGLDAAEAWVRRRLYRQPEGRGPGGGRA